MSRAPWIRIPSVLSQQWSVLFWHFSSSPRTLPKIMALPRGDTLPPIIAIGSCCVVVDMVQYTLQLNPQKLPGLPYFCTLICQV